MKIVWLSAFLISVVVAIGATQIGSSPSLSQIEATDYFALDRISEGSVVLIGSSLVHAMVPHEMASDQPHQVPFSRPHVRVTRGGLEEEETTWLIGEAVNRGADLVYVELNRYIIKHANKKIKNANKRGFFLKADKYSFELRQSVKNIFVEYSIISNHPKYIGNNLNISPDIYCCVSKEFDGQIILSRRKRYPLQLVNPRQPEDLRRVLQAAKSTNVNIVFFYPPRSQAVADFHGPEFAQILERKQVLFGQDFDVNIWLPDPVWPNEYFVDGEHVNGRGRKLFMTLLAQRMDQDFERK